MAHRLYRTHTTHNAVAKLPAKTITARIIDANSGVLMAAVF